MMVTDRRSARLERLEPRALSRRIVDQLKRVIIAGELRPGDRVLETDLAEQLGVSRGPVREAFRQLEQEGLLVSYPHRGTFVASVPEDEIEEVYALRAQIEVYATRRVVAQHGRAGPRPDLRDARRDGEPGICVPDRQHPPADRRRNSLRGRRRCRAR